MVEQIIASEGGAAAETTYDGRKLVWTRAAKLALWTIRDGYKRRRTKARIEKAARIRRLETVGLEFAKAIIEEETGVPLVMPEEGEPAPPPETQDGKKLIARDAKRTPLFSEFAWATDAAARILRVPAGFMRNRTQQRIEQLASERSIGDHRSGAGRRGDRARPPGDGGDDQERPARRAGRAPGDGERARGAGERERVAAAPGVVERGVVKPGPQRGRGHGGDGGAADGIPTRSRAAAEQRDSHGGTRDTEKAPIKIQNPLCLRASV